MKNKISPKSNPSNSTFTAPISISTNKEYNKKGKSQWRTQSQIQLQSRLHHEQISAYGNFFSQEIHVSNIAISA
jgi:uncharacterized protein VirK/YbjX